MRQAEWQLAEAFYATKHGYSVISANSSESYGGGAYMIQGTGYNLVVANNRCYNGTCRGGGIFLESAKFYNNTIAYTMATNGTGIYHWQDAKTGVESQL